MTRRFVFVGAAMAAALSLNLAALASANDYVFEPVKAEIKKGNDVIVSVRLKHKATGKPIADAVIVQTRARHSDRGNREPCDRSFTFLMTARAFSPNRCAVLQGFHHSDCARNPCRQPMARDEAWH